MAMYSWSDSLAIGVPNVDAQHKQLFETLNKLQNAMREGAAKDEAINTIKFLSEYVVKHFADEEAVMQKNNYPEYNVHKKIHEDFLKSVSQVKDKIEKDGISVAVVVTLYQQVGDWLVKHIGNVDKKVGEYIKAKGN